ncbi:alpha beta hydrolase fold protein [Colletotrichum incanum]|uniref:Alpha beta hydrolase fold protein n=1 Tax=Colletotrichum incanum TaxID=1573173 RepID=A0A161WKC2_COLIC|nr:alpha beta hydrolase fold protein [Colletotrichum incanum]
MSRLQAAETVKRLRLSLAMSLFKPNENIIIFCLDEGAQEAQAVLLIPGITCGPIFIALLQHLSVSFDIIIAHSLGTAVACHLNSVRPDLPRATVIIDPLHSRTNTSAILFGPVLHPHYGPCVAQHKDWSCDTRRCGHGNGSVLGKPRRAERDWTARSFQLCRIDGRLKRQPLRLENSDD